MKKMKWIDPSHPRRKVKRCEFCDADVSTPYKGVHQETEIINGIPTACRNNGRLNCDIAYPHFAHLHAQPKEGFKWFVEHKDTGLWWTGYKWTNDPLEAFACDIEQAADRFAKLQRIENYICTEHQFLDKVGLED